eukprot:TRINITY_DN11118_c0_g1_i5.p1 TRINITY_DN11118_c0_g1~~TRINITY_DN11118_c0_g1_i5.p1  ORF type:complete len:343 (+),score=69.10 TRINITY_DN11118_c0_g1_i5:233-1261(+)
MSDWTDNPFGGQDDGDNPFADASVAQAQDSVPEYNPFDQPTKPAAAGTDGVSSGAAAFQQQPAAPGEAVPAWASDDPPTTAAPPPAAKEAFAEPEAKQQSVAVTQRELEYAERERQAALAAKTGDRAPNFPNFPMWMRRGCITPCFHLDIKTEIPVLGQGIVRTAYYSWNLMFFTLFWNFICCLAGLSSDVNKKGVSAGLAAAYLFLFTPASYVCWFQTLYTAFRKDSSLRFGWFFLVMAFQCFASIFFAIGVPGTGASGIWYASATTDDDTAAGILMFTAAGLWIFNGLLNVFTMQRVLKVYRMSGYTTEDMQREAIVGVASNKAVQGAAKDAVFSNNNNA